MRVISRVIFAIGFTFLLGSPLAASWALDLSDKAGLQAAMQRHIQRNLVDGAYLHLKTKTGEVQRLQPVTPHPMIMKMGQHFVLCFDFRDAEGKAVEIDFYLARRNRSFVVFHAAIENRAMLMRFMKAGKVERAG
jgi:hypothetical protein